MLIEQHRNKLRQELRKHVLQGNDDYFEREMDCLESGLIDLNEFLTNRDPAKLAELNQFIDFSDLAVKLTEWSFYPAYTKIDINFESFDYYADKLCSYLEYSNDNKSNAYKFLAKARSNNWVLESRGLLGKYWITVYTDNFQFEIKSEPLTAFILNVYTDMIDEIEALVNRYILEHMRGIQKYYLSDDRIDTLIEDLSLENIIEFIAMIELRKI